MATFEFEAWTATVVILTLLCVWCFPALAPALHSLVTEAVTAVPATLCGHSLVEQRFLCPGIRGHTLGRRQAIRQIFWFHSTPSFTQSHTAGSFRTVFAETVLWIIA